MRKSIYILVCLILLMASCRTKKETSSHTIRLDDARSRFEVCVKKEAFKESLQSKIEMELSLPNKTVSSQVTLKIIKDRFIQLSIRPIMGIEMFRFVLSPDNILLIDRMDKRYVNEPIEAIEDLLKIDMDFNMLQALFSNRIFSPYEEAVDFGLFDNTVSVDSIIYFSKTKAGYHSSFTLGPTGNLIRTTIESLSQKATLQWNYSEFLPVAKSSFPSRMDASVYASKNIGIKIKGSNFQIDAPIEIDTTVSSRYEKVSLIQLYNMLQKLL